MTARESIFNTVSFNICSLSALFIAAYWIPIRSIVSIWFTNEDYSYGFIIPFITAYLIWERRQKFANVTIKGYWPVLPLLITAVFFSLYAILGSSGNISRPLVPILLILFTLFCFGKDLAKSLIFPLGFLIFMVPIPAFLEWTLGVYLKSISSRLGGDMISLLGIPVHVSGNIIDLGVTQLQVVDACSGLRYLFPLIALGFVYAYFFEQITWKRVLCVLATIPIAVLTNGIRIGITGILTDIYGVSAAEGFFHGFAGWALFLVSFIFLLFFGRLLRFFPPKFPMSESPTAKNTGNAIGKEVVDSISKPFIVSVALLIFVGTYSWSTETMPPVKLNGGIASFPLNFAGWQGRPEIIDPRIVEKSGAEESFSGNYQDAINHIVSLYIGYRSTAFLENDNFFHSPTVCLPSSGWNIQMITNRKLTGTSAFPNIEVSEMIIEKMGVRQLVYFWFQTKKRITGDKNINRFHIALHAIQHDNTYTLFIRPVTPLLPNETVKEAEKRMDCFVKNMMDAMTPFLRKGLGMKKL